MPDLTYSPPQPQTDDSELVIDHKTAVAISNIRDAIGATTDDDTANTVIGLLKAIKANTTPGP
jgi:hypothetical protein